jgi:tetratricopeptide (TPR) repeat protein
LAAAGRNVQAARTPLDISNGLSLWAVVDGDRRRALTKAELAIRTDSKNWAGWSECARASGAIGHDETSIRCLRGQLRTHVQDQWRSHRAAQPYLRNLARAGLDRELADYQALHTEAGRLDPHQDAPSSRLFLESVATAALHDCSGTRRDLAWAVAGGPVSTIDIAKSQLRIAACEADGPAALIAARRLTAVAQQQRDAAQAASAGSFDAAISSSYSPWLAQALVRTGQIVQASALIATTPTDCYLCLRTRAIVAAASGDPRAADRWFAEAVRQAPSPPFAWLEWGQAKLDRHDIPGAIAALAAAHRASPSFADPLEVWGEALLAGGDADGAAAKLSQASANAPRWGRVQIKWGEALTKLGKMDEARRHLAEAARLDLSAAERAELARMRV